MITIGLTGGMATGKSSVGQILRESGVRVVDSDQLAHDAVRPGTKGYSDVLLYFGRKIIEADGTINRKKLAGIIFENVEARRELERIIHPQVIKEIQNQIRLAREEGLKLMVVEVPLLFEVGLTGLFDQIWVVSAAHEIQVQRLTKRNQLTIAEAEKRIASQLPMDFKEGKADIVIDNNKGIAELKSELLKVLKSLE